MAACPYRSRGGGQAALHRLPSYRHQHILMTTFHAWRKRAPSGDESAVNSGEIRFDFAPRPRPGVQHVCKTAELIPFEHVRGFVLQKGMRAFIAGCLLAALGVLWAVLQRLLGSAIIEWCNAHVAAALGMTSPSDATVVEWIVQLLPPILATLALLFLYHLWHIGRVSKVSGVTLATRRPTTGDTEAQNAKLIRVIFGSGEPFETVAPSGVNLSRTVRVKIQNNTGNFIANGRFDAVSLDPPYRDNGNFFLRDSIIIPPRASVFLDVAYYTEGTSEYPPGGWISLAVPGGGMFAEAYVLLPVQRHTLSLRFSTLDGLVAEAFCALFVDSNSVLHLEHWGDSATVRSIPPLRQQAGPSVMIPALATANRAIPDMSVRELFFYIDPDCLGDSGLNAQPIGADIHDRLSTGQLIAWGREADRRSGSPLSEIETNYWRDAELTYWYFTDGFREQVHVQPRSGVTGPTYRDLQFNRAQAEGIWTPDSRPGPPQRIGAIDAFTHILQGSKWAKDLTDNPERFDFEAPYPKSVTPEERTRIRLIKQLDRHMHDKLRSGDLSSWGRPHHSLPLKPISKDEWDQIALITDNAAFTQNSGNACAMIRSSGKLCYVKIELSRAEVSKIYGLTI